MIIINDLNLRHPFFGSKLIKPILKIMTFIFFLHRLGAFLVFFILI